MTEKGVSTGLECTQFKSPVLKEVFTEARRFAGLKIPVLILGERGTGKTTLASWIRTYSPFRRKEKDASWPSVPCGQYHPETMRAELFGYKKGAFTEALRYLGSAHAMKSENQQAFDAFSQAIALEPNAFDVWYNRGLASLFTSRLGQAFKDFSKAATLCTDVSFRQLLWNGLRSPSTPSGKRAPCGGLVSPLSS